MYYGRDWGVGLKTRDLCERDLYFMNKEVGFEEADPDGKNLYSSG